MRQLKTTFVQTLVNFLQNGGTLHEAFALSPNNSSSVLKLLKDLTQEATRKRFPSLRTESVSFLMLNEDVKHEDVRTLYKGSIAFIEVIAKVEEDIAYVVLRIHFLNGNYFEVVKVMRDADLWSNTYVNLENPGKHANIGNLFDDLIKLGIYKEVREGLESKINLPKEETA